MSPARRIAAAVAALAVAAALAIVDPFDATQPAAAAVDQINGAGSTASAVTLRWADGITDASNRTIVTPRKPKGTGAFVDDLWTNFGNMKVTVSQTTGLAHQSVTVTWSGAAPTTLGGFNGNYLQMMQCYGDASTGPDPEFCQWGGYADSSKPRTSGQFVVPSDRYGTKCPAGVPNFNQGCDPGEPSKPDHVIPPEYLPGADDFAVPFVPVGSDDKIYVRDPPDVKLPALGQYFSGQSTNEIPAAATSADGTGEEHFEVQTNREASGLGCGADNDAGTAPRGCWLVIVPRGNFFSNNQPALPAMSGTPLAAGAWAQRLQVHLSFLPTTSTCSQDAIARPMVGTELASGFVTSWQPALCQHGGAVYSFAATPEATSAVQLASKLPGAAGLAFTTAPITFDGPGAPVLYAPVAITALTLSFRFDRNQPPVGQVRQIKVDPTLVAKSLTQSFATDLPGGNTGSATDYQTPVWMKKVVPEITTDPDWRRLNPDVLRPDVSVTDAPMTTADASAVNQLVWGWIQSNPDARAWLGGKADPNGMVVNTSYQKLKLGQAPPANTFPRADPICIHSTAASVPDDKKDTCITSVAHIPYAANLDDAAIHVQRANTAGVTTVWNPGEIAPDGSGGYWQKSDPQPYPNRFSWAITAAPVSARYGLPNSSLCGSAGTCVAPSAASLAAAVTAAKPDSAGLLHVNPATAGPNAYPLTAVVYAAVRTNQGATALRDSAALLDYASGAGQTPGVDVGQLPPGYLPLPAGLRAKTKAAATTLRSLANAQPQPPTHTPTSARAASSTSAGSTNATTNPTTAAPRGGASPVSAGPVPTGGTVSQPPAGLAAGTTPIDPLGNIRWVLIGALIASAAGSLGGLLLRVRRGPRGS